MARPAWRFSRARNPADPACAVIHFDALAGPQIIQRLAGQIAVTGKLAHRVVDIAIRRLIGQVPLDQLVDQFSMLRTYSVARGS
jgi:hypothetical protein